MAVNEFGDTIIEESSISVNEFGDPIDVPVVDSNPAIATSDQEASIEDFIKSQQAGPLTKLATTGAGLLDTLIAQPVRAATRLPGALVRGFETPNPNTSIPYIGGQLNNAQTVAEAGGRLAFDLGSAINQLGSKTVRDFKQNPLESYLKLLTASNPLSQLYNLRPRTPDQQEINNFLADQASAKKLEAVKSQPLLPEVLGKADIKAAEDITSASTLIPAVGPALRGAKAAGRAVAAPITTARAIGRGALKTVSPKMAARITPTIEETSMAVLDYTPAQVAENIPVVTQRVRQIIGKNPATADDAIKFIDDTENQIYSERLEVNDAATKQGLVVKGDRVLQAAKDTLDAIPTISPAQRAKILDDLQPLYKGDHLPEAGQSFQQRLNKEFSAQFDNGTFDRAAPLNEAKLAIRNSFADQMDEINRAVTGLDETPYADIGKLIEVKGSLVDKLNKIKLSEAQRKTGIKPPKSGDIPTTRYQAISKTGRSLLTPFQRTQLERLDDAVSQIFTESTPQASAGQLDQALINELRSAQAASPAVSNLESQIQETIRTLPREFRGQNERSIAEAILRSQASP